MPTIILHRDPAYADMARAYSIHVDGENRGTIKQKQTVELEVAPGPHKIQLRIDWCSSPELEVNATGDVRLGCRSNVFPLFAIYFLLFKQKDWIRLWQES